jgi:hypothetical protein
MDVGVLLTNWLPLSFGPNEDCVFPVWVLLIQVRERLAPDVAFDTSTEQLQPSRDSDRSISYQ